MYLHKPTDKWYTDRGIFQWIKKEVELTIFKRIPKRKSPFKIITSSLRHFTINNFELKIFTLNRKKISF